MNIFSKVGDFFALDIGSTAVRAMQLQKTGNRWSLVHYATAPIDIKVISSDAGTDQKKLGEVITAVIAQSGIRTKNVVLGIPSNKMFATVVDLPNMPQQELASTIKYQTEQFIPMSVDEAKVDWAVLGKSVNDVSKNEVLIASVANTFSEARLDLIENLGLNVIALEPDSLALVRSLLPENATDSNLILDIGELSTDIVMTYAGSPRLIRNIPIGMQTLVKSACQNLNVQEAQATQFILKFGLQQDRLEGQVFKALEATLDQFVVEITKSIKFFQTRYPSIRINSMIVSNYGTTIPGLADHLSRNVNVPAQYGNPLQKVNVSGGDEAKLQAMVSQFAVVIGLAEREGE